MTTNKGNKKYWNKKSYSPPKGNLSLGLRSDEPIKKFDIIEALQERDHVPKPERKKYTGDFIDGLIDRAKNIINHKIVTKHTKPNEMAFLIHQEVNYAENPTILNNLNNDLLIKRASFPTAAGQCYFKVYQDSFNCEKTNDFYFYLIISGYETRIIEFNLRFKKRENSFVYLAEDGRYFKIGKAKDLAEREKGLKTANPSARMMAYIDVDESNAYALETSIKKMFVKFRHAREWFSYDQSIIDYFYTHGRFLKEE